MDSLNLLKIATCVWFAISMCLLVLVIFQRAENAKIARRNDELRKQLKDECL